MGQTLGAVLISYDVDRLHTAVKEKMEELGYYDNWYYPNEVSHQMPNTTLWHKNKTSDGAIRDLQAICGALNVKLDKAVSVLAKEFAGI